MPLLDVVVMEEEVVNLLKDQVRKRGKKFVSYREGADLYSLGLHTFEKLAKDANAIYRVKGDYTTGTMTSGYKEIKMIKILRSWCVIMKGCWGKILIIAT